MTYRTKPYEWIQQDRNSIQSLEQLTQFLEFPPKDWDSIVKACKKFRFKITPYYLDLLDRKDPNCPIRKMIIPNGRETIILPSELSDPIGDSNQELCNQPVDALTHRYPDRVLLYPTFMCGSYCRYCFRRRLVGKAEHTPSEKQLATAFEYIKHHQKIREVILTGGDPLMLSDRRLESILSKLRHISHIRVLRIHTRMPVFNPFRITQRLAKVLKQFVPLWVVTHFNHPREVTETARIHLERLINRGIPVINQSVLLKGVNNNPETLRELGWKLIEARIKPYYLHHLDRAQGLSHFRVGVRQGIRLLRELRGTIPGYAVPDYVLDVPKGHGKVPLQYHYVNTDRNNRIYLETPQGNYLAYADEDCEDTPPSAQTPEIHPLEIYPKRA